MGLVFQPQISTLDWLSCLGKVSQRISLRIIGAEKKGVGIDHSQVAYGEACEA